MDSSAIENSGVRKCPHCNSCWITWSEPCYCDIDSQPATALTQPELDALLEAERVRVEQSVGVSLEVMKAQAARIAELDKALEPFAACAEPWINYYPQSGEVFVSRQANGSLRRLSLKASDFTEAARVKGAK